MPFKRKESQVHEGISHPLTSIISWMNVFPCTKETRGLVFSNERALVDSGFSDMCETIAHTTRARKYSWIGN
jgi:hypothetical protein